MAAPLRELEVGDLSDLGPGRFDSFSLVGRCRQVPGLYKRSRVQRTQVCHGQGCAGPIKRLSVCTFLESWLAMQPAGTGQGTLPPTFPSRIWDLGFAI